MCGIAGFINKSNKYIPNQEILKKMTDAIIHRGPDAEGQWWDDKVGFGHRRLSIIDLDEHSNQPMRSHDDVYVISYNGEVYNYIEIRQSLEKLGAVFKTQSDTEVIIEAYRYFGTKCFDKFNGMWALALYDKKSEKVIFSRDRFGVKPLYYINNSDAFAFASEIKAILAMLPEEIVPDVNEIYRYLSCTVNEDTDNRTFYKNIKIFPPAHYMVFDLNTNRMIFRPYWEANEDKFYNKWIKGKSPIYTFRKLFDDAIRIRLRADVEIGACLSGGLDSSSIVGCATKKFGKTIQTFSSIYDDKVYNEEQYIKTVNEENNAIPHYIRPDDYEKDFIKYAEEIIYHHDGPTGGSSMYSQYMVMKCVSGNVKVLLDGQGADEEFAGYIPYYSYYIKDLYDKGSFLSRLKAIKLMTIVMMQWPELIGTISTDTIVSLVGIKNSFIFKDRKKINELKLKRGNKEFNDTFLQNIDDDFHMSKVQCSSGLSTRLCNDILSNYIPSLLHNEDGNSMAFSIESRIPFLDVRIVEFAIALNGKYKIKNGWTKWIVRKALRKYLPDKIAKRKSKMAFPAAFDRWIRVGKSKEQIKEIIYAFSNRGIVPEETIDSYYKAHIKGDGDYQDILYRYFSMELWFRMCESMKKKYK